ncbi:MAG: hypothetical protein HUJ51_02695 [Eggerthellaceae bacterium]|nr:hypothetical protein [Eggerthellaceae bacterium]
MVEPTENGVKAHEAPLLSGSAVSADKEQGYIFLYLLNVLMQPVSYDSKYVPQKTSESWEDTSYFSLFS